MQHFACVVRARGLPTRQEGGFIAYHLLLDSPFLVYADFLPFQLAEAAQEYLCSTRGPPFVRIKARWPSVWVQITERLLPAVLPWGNRPASTHEVP